MPVKNSGRRAGTRPTATNMPCTGNLSMPDVTSCVTSRRPLSPESEAAIERLVAAAPPLTLDQLAVLRRTFAPAVARQAAA